MKNKAVKQMILSVFNKATHWAKPRPKKPCRMGLRIGFVDGVYVGSVVRLGVASLTSEQMKGK